MRTLLWPKIIAGATLAFAVHAAPVQAQSTRTWVSGKGQDVLLNPPCTLFSPCKTLQFALKQTAAGGEISVLDPDGMGQVIIDKAITINGEGTLGSILTSAGAGITVDVPAKDNVIIRNISINGGPVGSVGIQVNSGNVTVDKCLIFGFVGSPSGVGINATFTNGGRLDVRDTNITHVTNGIILKTEQGSAIGTADNVRINNSASQGIAALSAGAVMTVNRSFISNSGNGVGTPSGAGTVNVVDSVLSNNTIAVNAQGSGSTIRLTNNSIFDNATGFAIGAGATVATALNNKTAGNGGAAVLNGSIGNQ